METHPFGPFFPNDAQVLIVGTFPSLSHQGFYYTSPSNLMWPIFEKIFNKTLSCSVNWDICAIKNLCKEKGIALCDIGLLIERKKESSADKNLIFVQELDLKNLPKCTTVLCTGDTAYKHAAKQFEVKVANNKRFTTVINRVNVTFVESDSTSPQVLRRVPKQSLVEDDYRAKLSNAGVVIP